MGYRLEVWRGRVSVILAEILRRGTYEAPITSEELARALLGESGRRP